MSKFTNFSKLTCALGLLASAAYMPSSYAATAVVATPYAYSASVTITAPKGSSADVSSKEKNLPTGVKFSPCTTTNLDQLIFTVKYDAGKTVDDMQSVYIVFNKPDTPSYGFYPLVRKSSLGGAAFRIYSGPEDMYSSDTYTAAANNLGGAQTEVISGGGMSMETLGSGLWMLTVIVASEKTVSFDDASTWSAWDTVPFMLRKPWMSTSKNSAGAKTNTCE